MIVTDFMGCFFCGVDSKATLLFFVVFCSTLVGGGLFLLFYSIGRGDFRNIENPKHEMLRHAEDEI
jgi:hypothetical protein